MKDFVLLEEKLGIKFKNKKSFNAGICPQVLFKRKSGIRTRAK